MSQKNAKNIVLIGSPNAGKTSLFNQLTGLNQHVGNYDGVTIDKKVGTVNHQGEKANIIDLPGTYSLYPVAEDERVVLKTLLDRKSENFPDAILFIANASNLKKSMVLLSQIIDLEIPTILCLNLMDLAEKRGFQIDLKKLEDQLQIPVLSTNAKSGRGVKELKTALFQEQSVKGSPFRFSQTRIPTWIEDIKKITGIQNDYAATLALCDFKRINIFSEAEKETVAKLIEENKFKAIVTEVEDKKSRIARVNQLIDSTVKTDKRVSESISDKIDYVLTHNFYGTAILVFVLFLIFQGVFYFAGYPMDLIDGAFGWITENLSAIMPKTWYSDLLINGVIAGIGGIVIFVPQIAILFGLVAILEESGYMPRAIYLSDKLMSKFGLNGRSLVSFISGVACAVPAIMSARSISNKKERLITIFVTPFISCSARLPVYIVLIAFVVNEDSTWGIFNLQGLVLFGLYFLGFFAAIATSYILHKMFKTSEKTMLALELPSYQWPSHKNVLLTLWEKTKIFVIDAGKVILVISIILWALVSFGPGNTMNEISAKIELAEKSNDEELVKSLSSEKIEHSYAGHLGKSIEPVIRPLGFDWKIGIALITSFAAREVFVGTMATIYSAGEDDHKGIRERMAEQRNYITGKKVYTPATAFSLLLFYVFAMQCMSTVAITKRETKSWSIAIAQLLFMTGVAYVASFVVFNYVF